MTVQDALNRLQSGYYNSEPVNGDTNPGGMGADGHRSNFPAAMVDVGDVGAHTVVQATAAEASAAAAAASEANAGTSETNAGASAAAAAQSEANAGASETSAGASAAAAAQSEANAGTSETNAGASAAAAAQSEANAGTSETNAGASAAGAAQSEANAGASETNAGASAAAAAQSEANAGTSETNAGASAAAAAQSETNAAASAQAAADTLASKAEHDLSNVDPATGRAALGLSAALTYKGDHDASGADPAAPSIGDVWRASFAGTVGAVPVAQGALILWTGTEWQTVYPGPRAVFRARNAADDSSWITIGLSAWIKVPLDETEFDTTGDFDATAHRFEPPRPGYYTVSASAAVDGVGVTGILIAKNGDIVGNGGVVRATNQASSPATIFHSVSSVVWLNGAGDYIELYALSTANGGRVIAPRLAGAEL